MGPRVGLPGDGARAHQVPKLQGEPRAVYKVGLLAVQVAHIPYAKPVRRLEPKPVARIWGKRPRLRPRDRGGLACRGPLLVKLLDPADWLSVQVHPPHEYALRVEGKPGKYEAWYVLSPGSWSTAWPAP